MNTTVLRILALASLLVTSGVHITLGLVDLIPGEVTTGPLFLGMGVAYLAGTPALLLRKTSVYPFLLLYAVLLIAGYATSRGDLPIEAIGLATKADEIALVILLYSLYRREERQ